MVLGVGSVSSPEVIDGVDGDPLEDHDPDTNTFSAGPGLGEARQLHSTTSSSSGQVLIDGGTLMSSQTGMWKRIFFPPAELYDPLANTMAFTGSMSTARSAESRPSPREWQSIGGWCRIVRQALYTADDWYA